MDKKSIYMWYSGPTDITGRALVEKLGISGGLTKPAKGKKMVIGWGTKTKESVTINGGTKVLNHPNSIKKNRNKFSTLSALSKANVPVANFCKASEVVKELGKTKPNICLPLVGRTNYHQSGKGFWLCVTNTHVKTAIDEGAQYFQNYIDLVDEYRIHTFGDKVVYAVKKTKRDNMEDSFVSQRSDKINDKAEKGKVKLDKPTMDYVLKTIAKESPNPDMIVRSNRRGWKFSHVKTLKSGLAEISKRALKAAGLEFGAVDCCIDSEGNPFVLEINSGPGLTGTTLNTYIDEFNNIIKETFEKKTVKKTTTVKVSPAKASPTNVENKSSVGSNKNKLQGMADMFSKLAQEADEQEAEVLGKVFRRIMG